jgi:hypothetical protein
MDKIVTTLGELFVREAQQLVARREPSIAWLDLIEPVVDRCRERAGVAERFARHDGVPQSAKAPEVPTEEAIVEDAADEGTPLPPATRDRLRDVVGSAADVARVHVSEDADTFARTHRADAVTIGPEMYFRAGAYAPQDPAGLALLTHEVTHVAEWLRPSSSWHRATDAGVHAEERLAHAHEASAMHTPLSPSLARLPSVAVGPAPVARAATPAPSTVASVHPMKAESDRAPIDAPTPPTDLNPNLDVIRRTLFRDLMNQIRVEFERGA